LVRLTNLRRANSLIGIHFAAAEEMFVSSRADRCWVTSSSYPVRAGDKEAAA